MIRVFKRSSLLLAAIVLFSVLTVEPDYLQGYAKIGFSAFVERDAYYALCSALTITLDCHFRTRLVPVVRQVCFVPSHTVATYTNRGPPLYFLL